MEQPNIGFVGYGKMAEAMISGLVRSGAVPASRICASGPREERCQELRERYGIDAFTSNLEVFKRAHVMVLAVKPQMMNEVLAEMQNQVRKSRLIISIAAGVSLDQITKVLPCRHVVRCMPNTPGMIGKGITVWYAEAGAVPADMAEQVELVLSALGKVERVGYERYIDMATAISGSGPAYVYLFMEALEAAAVRLGLPRNLAKTLVLETVRGATEYAISSEAHLAKLRDDVTSPGGTTAEAVHVLDDAGFRPAISSAVQAAFQRALSLSK